jgi:hypothetical protein
LEGGRIATFIFLILTAPIVLPIAILYLVKAYGSVEVSHLGLALRTGVGPFYSSPRIPLPSLDRIVVRGPDFDEDEWCFVGPSETLSAVGVDGQSLDLVAGEFPPGMIASFAEELARECEQRCGRKVWRPTDT